MSTQIEASDHLLEYAPATTRAAGETALRSLIYGRECTDRRAAGSEITQCVQRAEVKLYNAEFLHSFIVAQGLAEPDPEALKPSWCDLFHCQSQEAASGGYDRIRDTYARIHEDTSERSCEAIDLLDGQAGKGQFARVINTLPYPRRELVRVQSTGNTVIDSGGNEVPSQRAGRDLVFVPELGPGQVAEFAILRRRREAAQLAELDWGDESEIGRYRLAVRGERMEIVDSITGRHVFRPGEIPARLVLREETADLGTGRVLMEDWGDSWLGGVLAGPLFTKICFEGEITCEQVPWKGFKGLRWRKSFYIYEHLDRIELYLDIDLRGRGTRASVLFPTNVSQEAQVRCEAPFACPAGESYLSDGHQRHALSWVDYAGEAFGVTIAHTGTPACTAGDGDISFSLDFDNGRHGCEFAVIPHAGGNIDWIRRAREFIVPPVIGLRDRKSSCTTSLISIAAPNVALSALKPAEDGSGLIMRIYEVLGEETATAITPGFPVSEARETSMYEGCDGEAVDLACLRLRPYEVRTIRLMRLQR